MAQVSIYSFADAYNQVLFDWQNEGEDLHRQGVAEIAGRRLVTIVGLVAVPLVCVAQAVVNAVMAVFCLPKCLYNPQGYLTGELASFGGSILLCIGSPVLVSMMIVEVLFHGKINGELA